MPIRPADSANIAREDILIASTARIHHVGTPSNAHLVVSRAITVIVLGLGNVDEGINALPLVFDVD